MAAFVVGSGEKVLCILFVVVSWLIMGKQMQQNKQNYVSFCITIGCAAVILLIGYLGIKF
jgi:uncharacterized membrane protein SirB2